MTSPTLELPPMPEPCYEAGEPVMATGGYTASAMRSYALEVRRQALEEAASSNQDKLDALRYRWLRNKSASQHKHPVVVAQKLDMITGVHYSEPLSGDSLDIAIAAAMKDDR